MVDRTLLPGKFVWFEHFSNDPKKAQAFYGEVLGWTVKPFSMGTVPYETVTVGDAMIGGYAELKNPASHAHWLSYVSTEDTDAATKLTITEGGKVLEAPSDTPDVGRTAIIQDPQGCALGLITGLQSDAPDVDDVPEGHFFWNELHTHQPEASLAFYAKLLGYTHKTLDLGDQGKYHIVTSTNGKDRGGVTDHLPKEAPGSWLPYVFVKDPDATLVRAKNHGGKVLMGPFDIPNAGRFGIIEDPTGAFLAVMRPNPRQQ